MMNRAKRFSASRLYCRGLLAVVAVVILGGQSVASRAAQDAAADGENPHLWKPRTRSVAVFKNGLGFFMREGEVQVRDGWCLARHIPPATFGTLEIFAHDEQETVDVVGSGPGEVVEFDGRDVPNDVQTKRARLAACENLKVQLDYKYKDQDRTAAGKLVSVGDEFVVLDSGSNSFAVPISGVARMQVLELPLRIHVQSEAEEQPRKTTLGMAYLRQGITWIPEYTLKVLDDETAELSLRGTLVNEAEDLIHTDVHLVVGVPHFVHTKYMAPVAVGQMIRSIGAAVAPQAVRTQIMNRAAIASNMESSQQIDQPVVESPIADGGGDLSKAIGNLPQFDGAAATDYTVYTKQDLTLRRGEKAIITLFRRKITYGHVYRWSPPERIQHSLVLHNGTDTAWTTGPCLAVSAERPLSEDLLKYTPKGGNGELPVTAAVNIAHDKTESEIERKLKAHQISNTVFYDLVTLKGELKLRNFEKSDVSIVIDNGVPGKPLSAGEDGRMVADPSKLKLAERQGTVSWRVKLKPDEEKTLTYQYERYVQSH